MQKKTIVILLCALILLPVFALPIHLQTGFSWNYDFWKLTSENTYVANRKNTFRFLQSDSETHFDVTLNGKSIHLQMTEAGENQYRFDFSELENKIREIAAELRYLGVSQEELIALIGEEEHT